MALIVLCTAVLMVVLDTTIIAVALPSIRHDLQFSDVSLTWVVNAYMLTFGGFLMLGGRLGDIYGHRRVLLNGIALIVGASILCAFARSQTLFILARAVQGLGAAATLAAALALIMALFTDIRGRARAIAIQGFVSATGSALAPLSAGILMSFFDWHWIFLVNVPVGVLIWTLAYFVLTRAEHRSPHERLDIPGACALTASLILATYAVVDGAAIGLFSAQTLSLLAAAAVLLGAFVLLEIRSSAPLIPLTIFKRRSIVVSSIARALWTAGVAPWLFLTALYMQQVLGCQPMQVALTFLLSNLVMAAYSLSISARLVLRFGVHGPLAIGMLLSAVGLAFLANASADGSMVSSVFPAAVLLGLGSAVVHSPFTLALMKDVTPSESGLASGIFSTAAILGNASGLAVLGSLAVARTSHLLAQGTPLPAALTGGYSAGFLLGAALVVAAVLVVIVFRPVASTEKLPSHV